MRGGPPARLGHPPIGGPRLKAVVAPADTESMSSIPAAEPLDPRVGRHISCTMTSILLALVRGERGEAGVAELIARSGTAHEAPFLENRDNWISLEDASSLLQTAIEVTGNSAIPRRVGEQAVRQHAGTPVATLLRSLGSPEAVLQSITAAAAKFSTVTTFE